MPLPRPPSGEHPRPLQRLDLFEPGDFERGRGLLVELCWQLTSLVLFSSSIPWPSALRARALRAFGATIGAAPVLRGRTYIKFPWKLELGDHVWVGEGCTILNLAPVRIGDHSALAHEVYLAAGSHDIASPTLAYANEPVTIGRGCWLATRSFVSAGVSVADGCVISAGAVVARSTDPHGVYAGVPARRIKERSLRDADD